MPPSDILEKSLLVAGLLAAVPLGVLSCAILRGRIRPLALSRPFWPSEPPLWGWVEILLVVSTWALLLQFSGALAASLLLPVTDDPAAVPLSDQALALVLAQAATIIGTGALAFVLVRRFLGQPWSALGISGTSLRNILVTCFLWLVTLVPIYAIYWLWNLILGATFGHETVQQDVLKAFRDAVKGGDWGAIAAFGLVAGVFAPLAEEVIFRGIVFGPLRLRWGAVVGAVVSSVIFAGLHLSLSAFLPLFVLGCLLCALYEKTGSLVPPMVFHAIFNGWTLAYAILTGGAS